MKILLGTHIKEADRFTMLSEPIESVALMERASEAIASWLCRRVDRQRPLLFLIGKGNNGGDGLAVARMMSKRGYRCAVCLFCEPQHMTEESRINLSRLPQQVERMTPDRLKHIDAGILLVDALLGTGVSGRLKEPLATLVQQLNAMPNRVVSIDIPSGMKTEWENDPSQVVHADVTLALEFPKLSMLLPEAGGCCGELCVLPIGLSAEYPGFSETPYSFLTADDVRPMLKSRDSFSHKGHYGHALLVCGSKNMMGAALLAAGGALRSGCALVTAHVPAEGAVALNVSCPSAMLSPDLSDCFSSVPARLDRYNAIGIGCGLGTSDETMAAFAQLLQAVSVPLVLDADALNLLSRRHDLWHCVPPGSVLTPHIGELRRLTGAWNGEEDKLDRVRELARRLQSVVVVKGAHTMVMLPDGRAVFNSTGNAGMAKGGCGDVLTGLVAGLLARGYTAEQAALLGVYFHGQAGDAAARKFGMESMNSRDLLDQLVVGRLPLTDDAWLL